MENETIEVAAVRAGIETASGGGVLPGMGYGWTSKLADQMQPHELSHRDGSGIDLDCVGVPADSVAAWAANLECVAEVVTIGDCVHVTLKAGSLVDLSGCPKPKKKKTAEEAPAE